MGFCPITEKACCCGYKNIIFIINLNLTMFLFNPLYLHFCICRMGHEMQKKRNSKNKLKFGFHCARHSVRLFFCQHDVISNHEIE